MKTEKTIFVPEQVTSKKVALVSKLEDAVTAWYASNDSIESDLRFLATLTRHTNDFQAYVDSITEVQS